MHRASGPTFEGRPMKYISGFVKEQLGERVIELMVADGGEKSQKH